MDENKVIVNEKKTDIRYEVIAATLMLIGVVTIGNTIVAAGKKFTSIVGNKIIKIKDKFTKEA